jgi:hypothetical protein
MSTDTNDTTNADETDPGFGDGHDSDEYLDVDDLLDDAPRGLRRLLSIGLGVLMLPIGIFMIPFAGPGWAVVAVSLNLIWPNNVLTRWIRKNWPGIDEDGNIPRHHLYIAGALMVTGTVVSLVWGTDILVWIWETLGITWDVPLIDAV